MKYKKNRESLRWKEIYIELSIDNNDKSAIPEIIKLAKWYINGRNYVREDIVGIHSPIYTSDKDLNKGMNLYKSAAAMGYEPALEEMESQIRNYETTRKRQTIIWNKYWKEKSAQKVKNRKSAAEQLGESWGNFKKQVGKSLSPLKEAYEDFEKGEKATNR